MRVAAALLLGAATGAASAEIKPATAPNIPYVLLPIAYLARLQRAETPPTSRRVVAAPAARRRAPPPPPPPPAVATGGGGGGRRRRSVARGARRGRRGEAPPRAPRRAAAARDRLRPPGSSHGRHTNGVGPSGGRGDRETFTGY